MDKVTILSRKRFLDYIPEVDKKNVVAIRIGDNKPINDSASKRYLDVLSLAFFDEWVYEEELDRTKAAGSNHLTLDDKIEIDNFIKKYEDKHFVIHCEQGVSRSAAVGYSILKNLGYTEELEAKKETSLYRPNLEVYGLLTGTIYSMKTASKIRDELKPEDEIF